MKFFSDNADIIVPEEKESSRVFLFIVDALRLDFMLQHDDEPKSASYNRFTYMHHLLKYNASQCDLFGFRADPPTVTSQRLKGLMTGTLPTFVDIGSNFNSSAIMEDNVIDQVLRRKSRQDKKGSLIVLGDDTWKSVFPHQFDVTHVYDSFNTKDLHTVDNGILQHLNESLHSDWDVLVAHFLGVDHIGHSSDAHHPLMAERLTLMDQLLQEVIAQLPEDTVLLLFGDHGMTEEGEHGGASEAETDSGLFVYFKNSDKRKRRRRRFDVFSGGDKPVTPLQAVDSTTVTDHDQHFKLSWDPLTHSFIPRTVRELRTHPRVVSQIDLTPTLSHWLGVPIPYSSLGMVIPELFWSSDACGTSELQLLDLLFANAMQVWRYLLVYFREKQTQDQLLEPIVRLEEALSSLHLSSKSESESLSDLPGGVTSAFRSVREHFSPGGTLQSLWLLLFDAVEQHALCLLTRDSSFDGVSATHQRIAEAKYIQFLSGVQQFGR